MRRTLLLAIVALPFLATTGSARETIVGRWGESRDVCGSGAAIDIGPMGLSSEETACEFSDVSRTGDVVTWKGRCFVHDAPSRQETVVATHNPDRSLTIAFRGSGAVIDGLRRCR